MPTRDKSWSAGTPCWIDYGAADLDAAKSFYSDILGWTYTGGEPEYGGYLTARIGDRAAAGTAPQMDPSDRRGGRRTWPPTMQTPPPPGSPRPAE